MAELTQFDRDYSLAQDLLNGARGVDKNGVQRRVFLSGKEEEAGRKALRRVLEYFAKTTGDPGRYCQCLIRSNKANEKSFSRG